MFTRPSVTFVGTPRGTFQCPHPWWAPADPRLHRRPSNTSGWFWFSLRGVTAPLLWVLVCTKFCLCPPRLESLFPPVLWKSYNQIPLALKARFPGDSQSLCQIPRLGSLTWGSEPSQQWENFFGVIFLQSVGHPPGRYGVWFYHDCAPPTITPWLLLCLWRGIFFLVGSSVLPWMIVWTASCSFCVLLSWGDSNMQQGLRTIALSLFWLF